MTREDDTAGFRDAGDINVVKWISDFTGSVFPFEAVHDRSVEESRGEYHCFQASVESRVLSKRGAARDIWVNPERRGGRLRQSGAFRIP
jgi:hypothetical protein